MNGTVTPPMPFATMANLQKFSITSAPKSGIPSPNISTPPSAILTGSTDTRGRKYVKEEKDWIQHRDRIAALYDGKTLKAVMAIMERDHGFVATERMYKARFKEWGLKKNVTAAEVHNLMHVMEQASTQCLPEVGNVTTVLELGKDIDVKKIQKYMKRRPVGLKKLFQDPKRPLDKIKALNVDNGKGRSGRGKVSIATAKLKDQQQLPHFHTMTPPGSGLTMPWSPESTLLDGLPHDVMRLLQMVVDHDLSAPHLYAYSPPLPASPASSFLWQPQDQIIEAHPGSPLNDGWTPDEVMLSFTNRLRVAHMLLDDGLPRESFEVANMCLNLLSTRFQQTQGVDNQATCMVLLYAFTAALEMAACFNHRDVLHSLFQHINILYAAQQPRMAEIAKRLPQLDHLQQVSTLKLARQMMSGAALGYSGYENPGYEVYSRTVDIAIGLSTPGEKLRALRTLASDLVVKETPLMSMWLEKRIALAVGDAPWAAQQQGLLSSVSLWEHSGESKMAIVLYYGSDCIERFKAAGDWEQVHKWATEAEWVALISLGYGHELVRKFRNDLEDVRSPMLNHSNGLPSLDSLHINISMSGFKHETSEGVSITVPVSVASSSPGWDPVITQPQGHETTLPPLWDMTVGVMDNGAGLYDGSFCKTDAQW